jgi:hypothetical protein
VSRKQLAMVVPTSWATIDEGHPGEPSPTCRYDLSFLQGARVSPRSQDRGLRASLKVEGRKKATAQSQSESVVGGLSRKPWEGDRARAGSEPATCGGSRLAHSKAGYTM